MKETEHIHETIEVLNYAMLAAHEVNNVKKNYKNKVI
tara:strand:- start:272 stop:382 length:111 start_codon:yes stop_codon:yes gene_type:complete